jgi:amino acid transporter
MKKVSLFALVMLMTGAVDGVSNLPSIAIFGSNLIFFFIAASLLFLLPTGLIAAELCKQTKGQGGIYAWSKQALGPKVGIVAIWLQWINTMVWFPTCLTTLVGTFAYLINPQLASHPGYLVGMSLSLFWIMTFLNLKGIHYSSKIASLATSLGMVAPMALIILLSIVWVAMGKPLALHIHAESLIPAFHQSDSWTSLTAIITSFLGMELAAVHVNKVQNAKVLFPKALLCSIILIVCTMGLGSLGVALVIPHSDIALATGTIQAFDVLFQGLHVHWLEPILGVMLLFGSLGTMINWLISPANGLLHAAQDGYLPAVLAKENRHGTAGNLLILQGIVVSIISSVFFLLPTVNGSYWLLLDLSTELYVMMYILMFVVAFVYLKKSQQIHLIPGKKWGANALIIAGLMGCIITFVVGFLPPTGIDVGGAAHYTKLFSMGLVSMIAPVALLYGYKLLSSKKPKLVAA